MVAIAFVAFKSATLWIEGPPEFPRVGKGRPAPEGEDSGAVRESPKSRVVSTKNIIEKNLFDPERGAGQVRDAEASSAAQQRLRSLILLGTAILGDSRYAILQEPGDPRSPAPRGQAARPSTLRLKLGDTFEGFRLSEVEARRVVFTKGPSRVEVVLDFFRKVEDPRQKAPAPTPASPGVVRKGESSVPAKGEITPSAPAKPEGAPRREGAARTPSQERPRVRRPPPDLTPKVTPGRVIEPLEVR